jgi:hypothetical protein
MAVAFVALLLSAFGFVNWRTKRPGMKHIRQERDESPAERTSEDDEEPVGTA